MWKILINSKGASIVSQIVALFLVSIAFYMVFSGLSLFNKTRISYYRQTALEGTRNLVIQALESEIGLANTIAANPALACLGTRTDCSAQAGTAWPIKVVSADGVTIVDPTVATQGFYSDGTICNTFDAANGNDLCPMKLAVTWTPVCGAGPCLNPQNQFSGAFTLVANSSSEAINVQRYSFKVFPSNYDSTLENNCTSLGGTFDGAAGTCGLPLKNATCPLGQVVRNVSDDNIAQCGLMHPSFNCGAGYKIDSISAAGIPSCTLISWCPPNSGPGRTMFGTWDPWVPDPGTGMPQGDGCDGSDGCDGGS